MAGAVTEHKEKSEIAAPPARDAAASGESAATDLAEKAEKLSLVEKEGEAGDDAVALAPANYIKHPLQNSWMLWFLHPDQGRDWKDRVLPIISFDTVEDFWSIYNHIKTPSEFSNGHDYYLFKQGIKPIWEHQANALGGKLEITWEHRGNNKADVDKLWLDTMLLLIGEAFDETDQINGVVVNIRKIHNKIALWLVTKDSREPIKNIAKRWRSHLSWNRKIMFHCHESKNKLFEF